MSTTHAIGFLSGSTFDTDLHIASWTDLPTCLNLRRVNKYCKETLYCDALLTELFSKLAPHLFRVQEQRGNIQVKMLRPVFPQLQEYHPQRWKELACYFIAKGEYRVVPAFFRECIPVRRPWMEQKCRERAASIEALTSKITQVADEVSFDRESLEQERAHLKRAQELAEVLLQELSTYETASDEQIYSDAKKQCGVINGYVAGMQRQLDEALAQEVWDFEQGSLQLCMDMLEMHEEVEAALDIPEIRAGRAYCPARV